MAAVLAWISGSGVVQGVIVGATFAFLTAVLVLNGVIRTLTTTVNGWSTIRKAGEPGSSVLVRAASAKALPAVNSFEEAAYWTATKDSTGMALRGDGRYVLRFPPGQLPPSNAFWSLTATDLVGYMVRTPGGRPSIDDRSDLNKNADGAIELHLQQTQPIAHNQNWLAIPPGRFKLMLRAYLPGSTILDGTYEVPPILKAE